MDLILQVVSINEKRYIFGASKLLQIERVSVQ